MLENFRNGRKNTTNTMQLGIEGEFIVTAGLFSECSDTLILLPFLNHLKEKTGKQPERLVADSEYESEETIQLLKKWGLRRISNRRIMKSVRRGNTSRTNSELTRCLTTRNPTASPVRREIS